LPGFGAVRSEQSPAGPVQITLNGEQFELDQPVSVADLLSKLDIDPRRVAVEHNLAILKRQRFPEVVVHAGDTVEIVNFVGGG
jgi:thiamine biosynthesis protein ThiS